MFVFVLGGGGGENTFFIREYACRPPVNSAGRLFFIVPCSVDGNNNHYYYYYCFMRPDRQASGVRITAGESSAHAYICICIDTCMYVCCEFKSAETTVSVEANN